MVLLDTSIWIGMFRDRKPWLGQTVRNLIQKNEAAICGQVYLEFFRGVRASKVWQEYKTLMDSVIYVEERRSTFEKATEYCRRNKSFSPSDAVIAAVAHESKMMLLTFDADFTDFAKAGEYEAFLFTQNHVTYSQCP